MSSPLHLLPIDRLGNPAPLPASLSELARDVCLSTRLLYDLGGFEPPWIGYLALLDDAAIGSCAFKGPPRLGEVEIACFTFPGFEGQGYAQAMVRELVCVAARQPALQVLAHTVPEACAAGTVLRKSGFRLEGEALHPEDGPVWVWRLPAVSAG
jgi:RimJ/RimL family protein N-acetyltransferase